MNKKFITIIIIIIILLIIGAFLVLNINKVDENVNQDDVSQLNNVLSDVEYLTSRGTIQEINDGYFIFKEDKYSAYSIEEIDGNEFKVFYEKINPLKVNTRVEIEYTPNYKSSNEIVATSVKYLGKSRILNKDVNVNLSDSTAPLGEFVYRTFYTEKQIDTNNWQQVSGNENKLYYKKIINYSDYQELMSKYADLRKMTEDDFVNYFAVIIASKDTDNVIKFKNTNYSNFKNYNIMNLLLKEENNERGLYSNLVVIIPNSHNQNGVNPVLTVSDINIDSSKAVEIAKQKIAQVENTEEYESIYCKLVMEKVSFLNEQNNGDNHIDYDEDKYINVWQVVFEDVKTIGCNESLWIDVTTGEILSYHWNGE